MGARLRKISWPIVLAALVPLVGCTSSGAETGGDPPPTPDVRRQNGMAPIVKGEPIGLSALEGTIVFDDYEDVYVMRANGTSVRPVTHRAGPEFDGAWSPDGAWIAYRDSRRGINENDEIFVARADGRKATNLTRVGANDWGPDWSPDGKTIVFNSDRGDGTLSGYLVAPDGSNLRPVDVDVWFEYPAFSPDGNRVAFMGHEAGGYDVYVTDLRTGATQQLTDAPGDDGFPSWSPDGTTIAFSSQRDDCANAPASSPCWEDPEGEPGEFRDPWIMDADGRRERRVTPEFGQFLTWSPDGAYLLVSGASLYVIRPDGTGRTEVRPSTGGIPDWIGR